MPREWYEIRVEGRLPGGWSNWFEGLDIQCGPDGDTVLSGPLPDQAALHGILAKIRDLNIKLVSVNRRSQGQAPHEH
ncbi:MAG: hypothetical protein ACYC1C_01320 [Chloroflexota bacterium]